MDETRGADDSLKLMVIVKKILAEGFCELNPFLREHVPHFGKLHAKFEV